MSHCANGITLLGAVDPGFLVSLRRDFPEEADLLTSSRQLGSDTLDIVRAKPERRKAIIKLLTASIKTERDQVEKLLYQIRSKMVLVAAMFPYLTETAFLLEYNF